MSSVGALTGITGTGQNVNTSPSERVTDGSERKNKFMKLLLEQLKHQNPMKPMSNDKMISQMAQLTTLEKMGKISENVNSLANGKSADKYLNLLGSKVTVQSSEAKNPITGQVKSVKFTEDGAQVTVGSQQVKAANITQVSVPNS